MILPTREQYINKFIPQLNTPQWSKPIYVCPKCGGNMRKNLWGGRSLTVNPPIREYEYRCDNRECNNVEYLRK